MVAAHKRGMMKIVDAELTLRDSMTRPIVNDAGGVTKVKSTLAGELKTVQKFIKILFAPSMFCSK